MAHTSVLLHESIEGLDIHNGDVFVDCTLGDGGHSAEVLRKFGDNVTIVGIDRDQDAITRVGETFASMSAASNKVILKLGNFRDVEAILADALSTSDASQTPRAQRFLFDIGLSSRQLEESGRGFSFKKDEPLLMTFEKAQITALAEGNGSSDGVTAHEVVNEWQEENLAQIIYGFGEERHSRKIAHGIVEARKVKPIETTGELVDIIMKSTPFYYHHGRIHPATRTFQAIRIAVNDELGAITDGLKAAWKLLTPQGRIAVISFHSLEDRIVKHYFNELKDQGTGKIITKRPITAQDEELEANPRSRSAKLRIIEKIS